MKKFDKFSQQAKGFVTCLLMMAVLAPIALTAAPPPQDVQLRELNYGVNVVVNGRPLVAEGADRPFILDGRTFLPAELLARALNIPTRWDGATRTVYIGAATLGSPLFETTPTTASNNITTVATTMSGTSFDTVLRLYRRFGGWSAWGEFNLNGQFSSLTGILGRVGTDSGTSTIRFIGDGRELASFAVDGTTLPHEISVNTQGVLVLRIEMSGAGFGAIPGLADPMLHQ